MKINKSLQAAATYIGAVMGAGFASGQEIVQFFIGYKYQGLLGIGLAGVLFALMGYCSLNIIKQAKITSYQELFRFLLGPLLGKVLEGLVTVFLFAGLIVMLAGSGAIFNEYFNLPNTFGVILTCIVIVIALASKGEGVLWINTVLIPLKLIICISVCLLVLKMGGDHGTNSAISSLKLQRHWVTSAILYVSFNLTFALVVLASLGKELEGNTTGGILGGVGLGVFAFTIGSALLKFFPNVTQYQVPMVFVASQINNTMGVLYLMVLWFAMITAAVGNAFSFVKRATEMVPISYTLASIVTLAVAIPLAHFKFSVLISVIYPLFGYIGFALLVPLVFSVFRKHNT